MRRLFFTVGMVILLLTPACARTVTVNLPPENTTVTATEIATVTNTPPLATVTAVVPPWGQLTPIEVQGLAPDPIPELTGHHPDDIVALWSKDFDYLANRLPSGGIRPPPLPVPSASTELKQGAVVAGVTYRQEIITPPGETRNNMVRVGLFPSFMPDISLYLIGATDDFSFTQVGPWGTSLAPVRVVVLTIDIPSDTRPGNYSFEIGVVADGIDYGTVTCSVKVIGIDAPIAPPLPTLAALPENRWAQDDLMYIPTGITYRNSRDPSATGWPFTTPETATAELTKGSTTIKVIYRQKIETAAGDFRNNIIQLSGSFDPFKDNTPNLYIRNIPKGFSFYQIGESQLGWRPADESILVISVASDTHLGRYLFDIGVILNGIDYGTVPCTVTVTQPATTAISTTSSDTEVTAPISMTRVHVDGSWVIVSGKTTLPDGMVLHSQLYEDNVPLSWWPVNKDIQAANGEWAITVPLGENGAPSALAKGPGYWIRIWSKENPDIRGLMYFDLIGLPPHLPTTSG
jgi:hypothetical protein